MSDSFDLEVMNIDTGALELMDQGVDADESADTSSKCDLTSLESDEDVPDQSKRKHDDSDSETEESRKKQKRSNETSTEELLADCGIIESITLSNFMCHDHFEITFNPRVNFVIGQNGSGKSAILTAIVIVLGGRASNTGRGQSLTGFIKHGKASAKIAIKLCNYSSSKKKSYKYMEYGKSIIVERIIKSDGTSNYILKSAFGKVISRKKEELNEIISLFSIQIDNPICILSQEVSRNFLNSKNPRDKYDFFMKATGLEQLKQAYAIAMQQSSTAKEILTKKKSFLPAIEKEVKELEKKVEVFTKFNKKKDELLFLIGELLWSAVNVLEREEKKPPKEIEALDQKINDCNVRFEEFRKANVDLIKLKEDFDSTIKIEFEQEMQKLVDTKNNLSKRIEELRKVKMEKTFKRNEINFSISNAEKDKKQLEDKIQDIKKQIEEQEKLIAEQELKKARKVELQNEQDEIKETIARLRVDKENKQEEYNKSSDSLKALNYRINKLSSDCSNKSNLLGNLKGSKKNSLNKFGSHFVRIVKLIDDECRRRDCKFKERPIGPLGNYIKLKDDHVSTALESCLKGLMFAFVCDNYKDAEYLLQLIKKVNPPSFPMVLRRRFKERVQIRSEVRLNNFKSFLSYVTIDDDNVFNIIMDKSNLDKTLYIPSDKTAVELLTNEEIVPSNLKLAYSAVGTQFYPKKQNSNFRQYSNNKKASGILTADTNEMIRNLEIEIEEIKESMKELNGQKAELDRENKSILEEIKDIEKEIDKGHSKSNKISKELYELSSIKEFKPDDLTLFESDYQCCVEQVQKLYEDLRNVDEELSEVEEKHKIVKKDLKECDDQIYKKSEKYKILENQVRENNIHMQRNEDAMKKIEKRVEEFNMRKENAMQQLTEIKLKKEAAIEKAKEKHEEPIETDREPNEIEKEVEQLNKFLRENENRLGDREELFSLYKEKMTHFEKMKDQVEFLERYINEFGESIKKRAIIYCQLRNRVTNDTSKNFTKNLKILNFTGSLQIYHKDTTIDGKLKKGRSLDIKINPKSSDPQQMYKDTRSLSGGERSFSTIAFLIALWESAYSPFNILDEVDVFMDRVTRNLALEILIDTANKKQGKQYIFLSPLAPEMKSIHNLLKIFYMPEPRRVERD